MDTNVWYVITRLTTRDAKGTFKVGDHICLYEDGTLGCKEAMGWLEKEDAALVLKGVEYKIDTLYYERKQRELQDSLEKITQFIAKE